MAYTKPAHIVDVVLTVEGVKAEMLIGDFTLPEIGRSKKTSTAGPFETSAAGKVTIGEATCKVLGSDPILRFKGKEVATISLRWREKSQGVTSKLNTFEGTCTMNATSSGSNGEDAICEVKFDCWMNYNDSFGTNINFTTGAATVGGENAFEPA